MKDFLLANPTVLAHGLVEVSSNLNKPLVGRYQATNQPPPQTSSEFRLFSIFLNRATCYFN